MTEPTEPRTWRTNLTESDIGNGLVPEDWPLGPVVVSTVPPDGVAVAADGRMVLLPGVPLPKGLEWRWHEDDPWHDGAERPPVGRPVEVRPVPAPEPERWRVEHNSVIRGDQEIQVYRAENTNKLAYLVRDLLNDYEVPAPGETDPDDDGLVTVLRDAEPTDPPSEAEPRLCRNCLARHRSDTDNTLCDRFAPAPSVVPADSPDTGRWESRPGGLTWTSAGDDRWEAHLTAWALAMSWGGTTRAEVQAEDAIASLQALVRREQPTAEQVQRASGALGALRYALDLDAETKELAYQQVKVVLDACRTTEGTGE